MPPSGLKTVYPVEPTAATPAHCAIDLDAVRRIALRAPLLGDPMNLQAQTFVGRLDRVLEHSPLNRLLLVAHALAEVARADEGSAAIFKSAGLARQIRAEVDARKARSADSADLSPAIVRTPDKSSHAVSAHG